MNRLEKAEKKLHFAVRDWAKARKGFAIVTGPGVRIISWPSDGVDVFTVGVQVLGRRPKRDRG